MDDANELIFTMLISNKYLVSKRKQKRKRTKKLEKVKNFSELIHAHIHHESPFESLALKFTLFKQAKFCFALLKCILALLIFFPLLNCRNSYNLFAIVMLPLHPYAHTTTSPLLADQTWIILFFFSRFLEENNAPTEAIEKWVNLHSKCHSWGNYQLCQDFLAVPRNYFKLKA